VSLGGSLPSGRPSLDLSTGGTFTRASAAFYSTQAPGDGVASFLTAVGTGVRRSADARGDGIAASLLMERSRTNFVQNCRDFTQASWATSVGTLTGSQPSPDGTGVSSRLQVASGAIFKYANKGGFTASGKHVGTAWVRSNSGTVNARLGFYENSAGSADGRILSVTTTYQRIEVIQTATDTSIWIVPGDGRVFSSGPAAAATDCVWDLVQAEQGAYPTSAIVTPNAVATRAADVLSYAFGAYPSGFLTAGVVVVFASDASSAEIVTASEDWRLIQVGANDYLRIRKNGAGCDVDLVCGGSIVATQTVTFSRAQALTITVKPAAGSLTVAGATTGNGTATGSGAAWASSATLYCGGDNSGANNVTGRYVGATIAQAA
jgi:hypothetical protein